MRLIDVWKAGDDKPSRLGLLRSTLMYYGLPWRRRRLARFYSQFITAGDTAFDVGAHVGNRIQAWRDIGATVVAYEPQPTCMRLLQAWYAKDPDVTLSSSALGSASGEEVLHVSARTPTVTTMSQSWQKEVQQADSFADVAWEQQVLVSVSTLDEQIARYGIPAFCKIDVEGYEVEVLRGLSQPIPVLSIEFIPATPSATLACIERLGQLGTYQFNWSIGESHHLQSDVWLHPEQVSLAIERMSINGPSGDLYARLAD